MKVGTASVIEAGRPVISYFLVTLVSLIEITIFSRAKEEMCLRLQLERLSNEHLVDGRVLI